MEKISNVSEEYKAALFAAGAYSSAVSHGMSGRDADEFARGVCKFAASSKLRPADDEDDEDEDEGKTWWQRNKRWALPTAIGAGAFLLGADAGRYGRPDRSYPSNALALFWERLKALVGAPNDPWYNEITKRVSSSSAPAKDGPAKEEPPKGKTIALAPDPKVYPVGSDGTNSEYADYQ